jgi:hypothetical protein
MPFLPSQQANMDNPQSNRITICGRKMALNEGKARESADFNALIINHLHVFFAAARPPQASFLNFCFFLFAFSLTLFVLRFVFGFLVFITF